MSLRPVHPHARGDISPTSRWTCSHTGPPPRAWGHQSAVVVQLGFPLHSVHPHARGDINCCLSGCHDRFGSVHPHARGDIDGPSSSRASDFVAGPPPRAWGHLTLPASCAWNSIAGPPPRAWGHPRCLAGQPPCCRSTPTRVGTSLKPVPSFCLCTVHPHARGDIVDVEPRDQRMCGPPPRAWRHLPNFTTAIAFTRSTPTRVGTSAFTARCEITNVTSVHPHARGDIQSSHA